MVNYYLTSDSSETDFDFVAIPQSLARLLLSWIHEEVPRDFIDLDMDADLDIDVNIDIFKFRMALLRTFVKDYNMEYLKENGVDF